MKVLPILFSSPLLGSSQAVLLILTPLILSNTKMTLADIAIITSFGSALFLFSTGYWSRKLRSWSYTKVLRWGLMGFALSHLILGLVIWCSEQGELVLQYQLLGLLLARIVHGLFSSAIVPTCQAWLIATSSKNDSNHSLAMNSAAIAGGRFIAPLISSFLLTVHWLLPLAVIATIPVINSALLGSTPKPSEPTSVNSQTRSSSKDVETIRLDKRLLLLALCLLCMCHAILTFIASPIALKELGLSAAKSAEQLAIIMSISAAIMIIYHSLIAKFARSKHLLVLLLGNLLLAVSCLILFSSSVNKLYFALPILNLAFAMIQLKISSWLCDHSQIKSVATGQIAKYQISGYMLGSLSLYFTNSAINSSLYLVSALTLLQFAFILYWRRLTTV